jgi:AcrR family transcriptional regulator
MPKVIDETIIFRTVLDKLVAHGYEGATTKEIAEIAGVNEATLFRKYGSKADLFEKAINHQLSDTPLNRLAFTGDLEGDLLAVVVAYMETNRIYGEVIPTLLVELPHHPELKSAFDTAWANIQIIIKIIQEYQLLGLLKPEAPITSLNALIGPLMTSQMVRRADLGLPVPDVSAQAHVNAFLHGRKP